MVESTLLVPAGSEATVTTVTTRWGASPTVRLLSPRRGLSSSTSFSRVATSFSRVAGASDCRRLAVEVVEVSEAGAGRAAAGSSPCKTGEQNTGRQKTPSPAAARLGGLSVTRADTQDLKPREVVGAKLWAHKQKTVNSCWHGWMTHRSLSSFSWRICLRGFTRGLAAIGS
jgi:hypothetical protein